MSDEEMDLVDQIHQVCFRIMCDVDDYCKKNNIIYYLSGGTCLGAVREKGFIHWDHDADLMMPRQDYERFLKGFAENQQTKYGVASLLTEKKWLRQYSKVWDRHTRLRENRLSEMERGVSIDIFPIDGLPENKFTRKIYYKMTQLIFALRTQMVRTDPFDSSERFITIKRVLRRFFGRSWSRRLAILLDNRAKRYDFTTSKYVGVSMACHYWEKETIESKYMSFAEYLPFEGKPFPVVNGYKQYLTNLYGDYTKVPPRAKEIQDYDIAGWEIEFDEEASDKK